MVLENQGVQYGFVSEKDEIKVKNDFKEMYYPSSEAWRSHVIDESKIVLDKSLNNFTCLEFY